MQITLKIGQEDKTFHQDFISARMFRRTIEIQKLFRTNEEGKNVIDETHIDTLVEYIVSLYGGQFTVDQFYDGIRSRDLMSTIKKTIQTVVGQANDAIGTADPN